MQAMVRRSDLAEFLRARRGAVTPEQVGLVPGPRRRTPGLRREEVALLAGVSVSWYTWLEQGRPINVSTDVLDALSRALQLDAVESHHLAQLAAQNTDAAGPVRRPDVPDWAHRLLVTLEPAPAYLLGPTWDYLAWNRAQARLFPILDTLEPEERNLVWAMFVLPETRAMIVDWEDEARQVLSQFRAETTPIRDDPTVVGLVARLRAASPEFDRWWPRHDVAGFRGRTRRFRHPQLGEVEFEYEQLVASGAPDLHLVVQLPLSPSWWA
jgi:transcriptional regulator with XRE-family HTH domain